MWGWLGPQAPGVSEPGVLMELKPEGWLTVGHPDNLPGLGSKSTPLPASRHWNELSRAVSRGSVTKTWGPEKPHRGQ